MDTLGVQRRSMLNSMTGQRMSREAALRLALGDADRPSTAQMPIMLVASPLAKRELEVAAAGRGGAEQQADRSAALHLGSDGCESHAAHHGQARRELAVADRSVDGASRLTHQASGCHRRYASTAREGHTDAWPG